LASSFAFAALTAISMMYDIELLQRMRPELLRGDARRILKLSEFFAHGMSVVVVLWATWVMARHFRRHLLRLLMCAAWPPMIVHGIKTVIIRRRPTSYLDDLLVPNYPATNSHTWRGVAFGDDWNLIYQSQSFPSAHTALVVGFAIGLCWLYPKGKYLFISLACLASLQRIVFHAHWPSDVLASVAVALLVSGGLVQNWGLGYWMGQFEGEASVHARTANE
jgi:membrane-associated phospholipid phosphatase